MRNEVFTVSEIAEVLRISTKTAYKLIQEQSMPYIRVRGQIRITAHALDNYLRGDNHNEETASGQLIYKE